MPPAQLQQGDDLAISIDRQIRPLMPGDTITGEVVRAAHAVCPMGTVTIQLLGRAKVRIKKTTNTGSGASVTYYRGRFNFFDNKMSQQLHSGPIHIPPGGEPQSWKFTMTIPHHPNPTALLSSHAEQDSSLLALEPASVASYALPGSFMSKGSCDGGILAFTCYVEYHLEAQLVQQGKHAETSIARLPFLLQAQPVDQPSVLKRQVRHGRVSTWRLTPGMEQAQLSFKQKAQKVFSSSKVPSLGFLVQVDCPGVIRLGGAKPVDFCARIRPNRQFTSDALHGVPHKAEVTSLHLVIKAETFVVAPGNLTKAYHAHDTNKAHICLPVTTFTQPTSPREAEPVTSATMDLADEQQEEELPAYTKTESVVVPEEKPKLPEYSKKPVVDQSDQVEAGPSSGSGKGSIEVRNPPVTATKPSGLYLDIDWDENKVNFVNIGRLFGLRINATSATCHLGSQHYRAWSAESDGNSIYPSFTTYCINHKHSLKWKMSILVGGETVKWESEVPITVLGPK